ncbi:hypothetical protein LEP1GSC191_2407 [Leptospira borgpetersenii serovar Mini str. 201000851]|uniref:Uncharacterized protein n=2 Tax=Leptospira borgpetersenii TaxID=174 RepID=A0A0S2IWS0_LEPBO|nr:hypothetical protein LBBP_03943 [Leptospira borgpetersenii serovar Ballum]EKP12512.1 hypothetical protein LEP1GSC128_3728 [Leptospira borgpetersenii str. 200801926]EKR00828.1 hypothetical protein LEP1GSC121_0192 [Leptospira borgpetersenii serovar Castellonis str. 200801910]EMK12060.1 hypothetical protein LEP1GSC066_2291 [Leptospira sp. serovar Kenya str. Sh9]ENO65186.1 hypothetical protein LEP1GSC191_2407 [Leptospira borgpetersenii serovar Mini str. 201000851]
MRFYQNALFVAIGSDLISRRNVQIKPGSFIGNDFHHPTVIVF